MGELTDDQLFGLLQWFVTDSFGGGSISEAVRTQRFDSWETLQKSTHSRRKWGFDLLIQVFYGCHMMLVENIEQGGVDPGPSAATQALASTLVDALSERNYKVFFPSEKTPDPVRNRRVFAPETMQIEAVNLSPEAMRSPTKFIPETQAPTGDHGDDDENRKMANTAAFKTPHGITSKDDEMRDTLIEEDEDDDYSSVPLNQQSMNNPKPSVPKRSKPPGLQTQIRHAFIDNIGVESSINKSPSSSEASGQLKLKGQKRQTKKRARKSDSGSKLDNSKKTEEELLDEKDRRDELRAKREREKDERIRAKYPKLDEIGAMQRLQSPRPTDTPSFTANTEPPNATTPPHNNSSKPSKVQQREEEPETPNSPETIAETPESPPRKSKILLGSLPSLDRPAIVSASEEDSPSIISKRSLTGAWLKKKSTQANSTKISNGSTDIATGGASASLPQVVPQMNKNAGKKVEADAATVSQLVNLVQGDSDSDWEDSPNRSSNHVNKLSTSASKKRKSAATARSKKGVKSTNQWGLEISEATASQVKGFKAKVQTTLTNFVSKPSASEAPAAPSETVKLRNREMSTKKPVRSEEEQFQGDLSRALELSKQDQYNTSAGVYCVSPIKSEPVPPKSSRQNKPPSRALELLEQEYKSSSSSELCAVSPIKDDDRPPAISRPKSSSNPVKSSAASKDDKSLSKVKSEIRERKPLSTVSTLNDSFNSVPEKPSVGDRKVLGKERLKLLIGHECRECYEFYEALDDWTEEDIARCMNKCSKHRAPKEQLDRDRSDSGPQEGLRAPECVFDSPRERWEIDMKEDREGEGGRVNKTQFESPLKTRKVRREQRAKEAGVVARILH